MNQAEKISLLLLRFSVGALFFYAGISKVFPTLTKACSLGLETCRPVFSAAGFLKNAQAFTDIYGWFASASNIGWVNFMNKWGLTLIGLALIVGATVRLASISGILLMALYYLPTLRFPFAGDNGYIVDDHIIYIFVLAILATFGAGQIIGLDKYLKNSSLGRSKAIG